MLGHQCIYFVLTKNVILCNIYSKSVSICMLGQYDDNAIFRAIHYPTYLL